VAVRVLVVDDHAVVRQGLRMYLGADGAVEVVGEASDGAEALERARLLRPDVVLMDLLMPRMDGVAATEAIRRELPGVEVIALTSVLEDGSVAGAVRAGAAGYVLKTTDARELRRAVETVAAGRVYLTPEAAARLAEEVRAPAPRQELTARESEVLALVARGLSNKRIARELHVTEKTVKSHVSSILGKLGLTSRTQAALHAVRTGAVPLDAVGGEGR
jgi:NarL family two-component system response regulator LiaR